MAAATGAAVVAAVAGDGAGETVFVGLEGFNPADSTVDVPALGTAGIDVVAWTTGLDETGTSGRGTTEDAGSATPVLMAGGSTTAGCEVG
ncbi:MAG: hypothetical protein EBR58_07460 [Betaproteobacteria bacterium]|nr:hypothetical protein [Betaproteobacteria bacterium]